MSALYEWNWTIILGIFHFNELYLYKRRDTFVWVFYVYICMYNYMFEKKHIWTLIIGIFHFHWFFLEILIKSVIWLGSACLWNVYLCTGLFWKMYVRLLCLRSYYWQYFAWINAKMEIASASLPLAVDNSLVHERRARAAVKLHLNPT